MRRYSQNFSISFANGDRFHLVPTDPKAADVVDRLATAMNLTPEKIGTPIFVRVNTDILPSPIFSKEGEIRVCILKDDQHIVLQMAHLARFIAIQVLSKGGLLVHGALIEKNGFGIILTGPGTVGKTTACRRIPEPWNPLCDDTVLVVPARSGRYYAHPWPTWSRFLYFGPWESWNVEEAVDLNGIFVLSQAPNDQIGMLTLDEAVTYLIDSLHYRPLGLPYLEQSLDEAQAIYNEKISAIEYLVQTVPVNILRISLVGQFWEDLSTWLDSEVRTGSTHLVSTRESKLVSHIEGQIVDRNHTPVIYVGGSMNPLLQDYDLLEVSPYEDRSPEIGDVICFYPSDEHKMLIHRIIEINDIGFRTQGDNNPAPDRIIILKKDIIGQVMGAKRGKYQLRISGGKLGTITFRRNRVRRYVRGVIFALYRKIYPALIYLKGIHRFAPDRIRPRVVVFSSHYNVVHRLFIGKRLVGRYNPDTKKWEIPFPFWLMIDQDTLPVSDP